MAIEQNPEVTSTEITSEDEIITCSLEINPQVSYDLQIAPVIQINLKI